ncbi:MAG: HI0074 family nucleotidyltransferase substrate-binding subunit [Legionellales bacterium]
MTLLLRHVFLKKLAALTFIEKIILYGSRARGDNKARSDIDLAIECSNPIKNEEWQQIITIIDNADTLLKIDCIKYNDLAPNNPLKQAIDKDGKIIYIKETMNHKIKLAFELVDKAIVALKQMVDKPMQADRSNIDACIQRFEFTIELFWKLLKRILESKGQEATYPKDVLREAYKGMLIDDETIWLQMLEDRNRTSHAYNQDLADEIYTHITKNYYPVLENTYQKLKIKF